MTRALFPVLALVLAASPGLPARADTPSGRVAGRYNLALAGLPIGTAELTIVLDHGSYRMMASAQVGGVLSLLTDTHGTSSAQGRLVGALPAPANYALRTESSDKDQSVRMSFHGGGVADTVIDPPVVARSDRIPVTPEDRRGAIDPLSALLVPGTEATPAACHRTLPVFDGVVRFDVPLTYSRTETVQLDDGFSGQAVVCSARYRPLAGHRPDRAQTKYMMANKDLEYWLVAMPGAPVLVPWRVVFGTRIGRVTLTAQRLALGHAADLDEPVPN